MPAFERILDSDLISQIWREVIHQIKAGRFTQLITLKPIEVYQGTIPYEIEGAKMDVDIQAHLENLIQRRLQKTIDFLALDFKSAGDGILTFNVGVDVQVKMNFQNMAVYLNGQYANEQYWILDNHIGLLFHEFRLSMKSNRLHCFIPMRINARYNRFKYQGHADVFARGDIDFNPITNMIKIKDISYAASSDKFILRLANMIYYRDIVEALEDFLQFNVSKELEDGFAMLQKEVERYNEEYALISGEAISLKLNRIDIHPNGGTARLHIDGLVKLLH